MTKIWTLPENFENSKPPFIKEGGGAGGSRYVMLMYFLRFYFDEYLKLTFLLD